MALLNKDPSEGKWRKLCTFCSNWGLVLDLFGNPVVCHRCHGSSQNFSEALLRYYSGYRGFRILK